MRAVCYPRVSSAQQRERHSIDSQLRELPAIAERKGWTLVRDVTYYVDDGRTAKAGKLEKRTGLTRLLNDAAAGEFDVVIMAAVDRLTRSEKWRERGMIIGALQDAGVRVCSADSGELLDLDTDEGDLIMSLKSYVAAADNRRKSKAIRLGKESSALRGGKPTGRDPFGLTYSKATNTWSVVESQRPIVVEIFERVAAGESCISVACDLELRAVPGTGKKGKASHWDKRVVRDLVRSTHPIGEYMAHRKSRTIVKVPAIVDIALWQRAQETLVTNRKSGLSQTKNVYLLQGLGVCALCGEKMRMRSAAWQKGRWFRPAAYVCQRALPWTPAALRKATGEVKCTNPAALVDDVDARVWAAICRELEDPALPGELARERKGIASDTRAWEKDADGYRAHLTRLETVEGEILARFRRGLISDTALDKELAALRRERAAVRTQLAAAESAKGKTMNARARLDEASAMVERLRAKLATATPAERHAIACTLIDPGGAVFHGREVSIDLFVEKPASARGSSSALVGDTLSSDSHQLRLRIRVLAPAA